MMLEVAALVAASVSEATSESVSTPLSTTLHVLHYLLLISIAAGVLVKLGISAAGDASRARRAELRRRLDLESND